MPPLISKKLINAMDSGDESGDKPMSTDMLEDICDGSQSPPVYAWMGLTTVTNFF